jgi:hypothetical protein
MMEENKRRAGSGSHTGKGRAFITLAKSQLQCHVVFHIPKKASSLLVEVLTTHPNRPIPPLLASQR